MTLKINTLSSFPSIYEKIKTQKLPFKTSYKLSLLVSDVQKHIDFYNEKLREILIEYGEKDENGNLVPTEDGTGIKLVPETMAEAHTKVNELQDIDVDLKDIKFTVDEFGNIELTPDEVGQLLPFITMEE